jgi:hypothetical protein
MAVNFEHALNCKSRNIEDFYLSSNQAYGLDEPVKLFVSGTWAFPDLGISPLESISIWGFFQFSSKPNLILKRHFFVH